MDARREFERLYEAHAAAVLAYALRRADPASADDVVAEVFLVAWRRLAEVPPAPRAWLLGVARRVLANQRRGEARREALAERIAAEPLSGAEAGAEAPVLRALAALSDEDQEILRLAAWDELTRAEAAAVLGITTGAFGVRLYRARRRLEAARASVPGNVTEEART